MEPNIPAEQATPDFTHTDIARGSELRHKLYREAYNSIEPDADGVRRIVTSFIADPFGPGLRKLAAKKNLRSWIFLSHLEITSADSYTIAVRARRLRWTRVDVLSTGLTGGVWQFRTTFLMSPDEVDAQQLTREAPEELPSSTGQPMEPVELEKALSSLLRASIKFRGEEFVGDPDPILKRDFGGAYNTENTVEQLIDAGLAEWRDESSTGTTAQRLYLKRPLIVSEVAEKAIEENPSDSLVERIILAREEMQKEMDRLSTELEALRKQFHTLGDALGEAYRIQNDRQKLEAREAEIRKLLSNK